jgi:hypothetical protein
LQRPYQGSNRTRNEPHRLIPFLSTLFTQPTRHKRGGNSGKRSLIATRIPGFERKRNEPHRLIPVLSTFTQPNRHKRGDNSGRRRYRRIAVKTPNSNHKDEPHRLRTSRCKLTESIGLKRPPRSERNALESPESQKRVKRETRGPFSRARK